MLMGIVFSILKAIDLNCDIAILQVLINMFFALCRGSCIYSPLVL